MELSFSSIALVCAFVFLAGFVDSIAGGGGIISLPAYIFVGIPPHFAYGTNKFVAAFGTFVATLKYFKSGFIRVKPALIAAACALIGSYFGAELVMAMDEKYLQLCLVFLLPLVAIFMIFKKNAFKQKEKELPEKKLSFYSGLIGLCIGAYDGFFGPGTGTFLVLAFTGILGLSMTSATGNAKVVNLASNIAAFASFLLGGKVLFAVGVPALIFSILGNYLGASLAVKNGEKIIRPIIILSVTLLFIKVFFDLLT